MSDIELTNVRSGYNLGKINENFEKIETKINNEVMHLEGDNNIMRQALDMNGYKVLNLPVPTNPTDIVRVKDVGDLVFQSQLSYVQEDMPTNVDFDGSRWYKPSEATTYVYYTDGSGDRYWVEEPVAVCDPIATIVAGSTTSELLVSTDELDVGTIITTTGYSVAGDGGAATWKLTAITGTVSQSPAQLVGALFNDALGRQWSLVHKGAINPLELGAVGDGVTDDTLVLDATIAATPPEIVFTKLHCTTGSHELPSNITLRATNAKAGVCGDTFTSPTITGYSHNFFYATSQSNILIDGLKMDNSAQTVYTHGTRCITMFGCSDYKVVNCNATCTGAFIGSMNCTDYEVSNNFVTISEITGTARHDGVIDQWYGSNSFRILNNVVKGEAIAKYGILVTGADIDGNPTNSFDFEIRGNKVYSTRLIGIQAHGRLGSMYDFNIESNTIDTVTEFHGIGALDCYQGFIKNNRIYRTAKNGLQMKQEGGGFPGNSSASEMQVSGNLFVDCCTDSPVGEDGAVILCISNSFNNSIFANNVIGSTHNYALRFGVSTTNNEYYNNALDAGTSGTILDLATSNRPDGGFYAPTIVGVTNVSSVSSAASAFWRQGDTYKVSLTILVTPTTTGTTEISISLPVASNFAVSTEDCIGAMNSQYNNLSGAINADITNDVALFTFTSTGTAVQRFYGTFTYKVL